MWEFGITAAVSAGLDGKLDREGENQFRRDPVLLR